MSTLTLRLFDGSRQPFTPASNLLVTLTDGNQTQQIRQYYDANAITFNDLPFFDNFGDDYTALAYKDGFQQAGYQPVKLSNRLAATLDLMLIPNDPSFNFALAPWPTLKATYPYFGSDATDAAGQQRYQQLMENAPKSLACLLNLSEAMSQINLAQGSPLDYLKQIRWETEYYPRQDRFFAWCDVALIDQVKQAAAQGQFAAENDPGLLHPGATASWKQVQFGEANVQLTFHENDKLVLNGVHCVMIEPDMDYYKDPLAHVLLEVIPNAFTGTLTDPAVVYVLRWIAGQTAGTPEFSPLYIID
jgi:hypothetical protein